MVRVSIIGATGKVGQYAAPSISRIPYVGELVLCGRVGSEGVLEGVAHDLSDSFAATGTGCKVRATTDLEDLKGSDVIVFTAGSSRRPDQSRIDLAQDNAKLVASMSSRIGQIAHDSVLLMVTNPVDIMTHVALKYSGMEPKRVFGLGTHLDSMRLKSEIAQFFKVHVSEVHTRIIGEHGDSMVPLWSATTIGGIKIKNLRRFKNLPTDEIMETVRSSGQRIIASKGATILGPGDAIATIVRTILGNENRILTVSTYVSPEIHNNCDDCIGYPAMINQYGADPVPILMDSGEEIEFQTSVEKIRSISSDMFAFLEKENILPG